MPSISLKKLVYACSPSVAHPLFSRIEASDVGLRLGRGMFWTMAGSVISRGLILCAMVLVARMLGKTVYGELGMIQSTVGMFSMFAGVGLGLTATKHVAEFRHSDPERAGRIIGLSGMFAMGTGGLIGLGLFIFAPWLAEHTINAPHLYGVLRVGALILLINALNGVQTGALAGLEAFKTIAHVNLFVGLISFPVLICGAHFGGLTGTAWALAINLCLNWLLNHIALSKEARRYRIPITLKDCKCSEWAVLWRFSFPAALSGALVGPINWACSALLVNRPNGYNEMGIYSAANQWYAVLMFVPIMLSRVVLPVFSNQFGQKNTKQPIKTLILSIKSNLLIVSPLIVLFSITSPYIMKSYGKGFIDGWPTLVVVLMTAGFVSVNAPVGQFIAASGKMWIGFFINGGWALIFCLNTIFMLDFGAFGLAISRMLAYIIHSVWVFIFAFYLIRKRP
jgi:O-antigen/teichoic acid export membrane protein